MHTSSDNTEIRDINFAENMVRTKLTPTKEVTLPRAVRRQWPPRGSSQKFKIKTLLPEQKTIEIKKNGQVIRKVTVRRKRRKFTDRWAKTFLKIFVM